MRVFRLLLALLLAAAPTTVAAQDLSATHRPHAAWRTIETENYRLHYPVSMEPWALHVARQMEPIHQSVAAAVGRAPDARITMVVDDPLNIVNGFAIPFRGRPFVGLYPNPPGASSAIGHLRDWGELLTLHEVVHIAHLDWHTRNPRQRLLWSLVPVEIGPVARRSPRWVTEGYATYLEGRLTGSGRPHAAWRAAVLRQWALEGRLPTYAGMSGASAWQGRAMAYLAGSAYLEWLEERSGLGEEAFNHLWRRMSARQVRSFEDAFSGVFAGRPSQLYGRFTAEITAAAMDAERALTGAGLEVGDTVQVLARHAGEPAVSPEGSLIATVLSPQDRPSRVVVWETDEERDEEREREARERMLERDPLDVPAVEWRPRPRTAVATLPPTAGFAYTAPRFHPDGESLLVLRQVPLADGPLRWDLFRWWWGSGRIERITRGAGIRSADPLPDGEGAVAARCLGGVCDIVRVDLRSGATTVLHPGDVARTLDRPRVSPDGTRVAFAEQMEGRWHLRVVPVAGGEGSLLPQGPDNRYQPSFLPAGDALVAVSEEGGIANLQRIDLADGTVRHLTRVTGAAAAPSPDPATGGVFFLNLTATGWDLHRLHPDSVQPGAPVPVASPYPIARQEPDIEPPAHAPVPIPDPVPYGLGRQRVTWVPSGGYGPGGGSFGIALTGSDPIGRLSWLAEGLVGDAGAMRGGRLGATLRVLRPALRVDAFHAEERPSAGSVLAAPHLDATQTGGGVMAELLHHGSATRHRFRAGGVASSLEHPSPEAGERFSGSRAAAHASYRVSRPFTGTRLRLVPEAEAHGALGRTLGEGWGRIGARGSLDLSSGRRGVRVEASHLRIMDGGPQYEHPAFGGASLPLLPPGALDQRVAEPGLPPGVLTGERLTTARVSTALGPLRPYLHAATTEADLSSWLRVAGAEAALTQEPLFAGALPGVAVRAGFGVGLDGPVRGQTRLFATVRLTP